MLTPDQVAGLGVALNEATVLDVAVDPEASAAELILDVLSLPPEGPAPVDTRVCLRLGGVARVCGVFRQKGESRPLALTTLAQAVRELRGGALYGWEFIDTPFEEPPSRSLDWRGQSHPGSHRLWVFSDAGPEDGFDLWIWFETFEVRGPAGEQIPVAQFIEGGRRWWDALFADDPRARGRGIVPMGPREQR